MDYSIVDGPEDTYSGFLDRCMVAYDQSDQTAQLLDLSRDIYDAENYVTQLIGFPTGNDCFFNVAGGPFVLQTFSGDITVRPFSYITKISFYTSQAPGTPPIPNGVQEPFKLRVYDKGGKVDLIYTQFASIDGVAGRMVPASSTTPPGTDNLGAPDAIFGPYYLLEPKILMPPGVMHVELTNMGMNQSFAQVVFMLAVPLS